MPPLLHGHGIFLGPPPLNPFGINGIGMPLQPMHPNVGGLFDLAEIVAHHQAQDPLRSLCQIALRYGAPAVIVLGGAAVGVLYLQGVPLALSILL